MIPSLLLIAVSGSKAQFIPLGDLPGGAFDSSAYAISADGKTVVGRGMSRGGNRAFLYREGVMTELPTDGQSSGAFGVSGDGSVVVGRHDATDGAQAAKWSVSRGSIKSEVFDHPGGRLNGSALAVSTCGRFVVGRGTDERGVTALLKSDTLLSLGDLPGGQLQSIATSVQRGGEQVVGWSSGAAGPEAFLWTPKGGMKGLSDLPGGAHESRATDISDDGRTIIGVCTDAAGTQPCKWTEDSCWAILQRQDFAGLPCEPRSISADGSVVVGLVHGQGVSGAFIWTARTGIRDLTRFASLPRGFTLTAAQGVSSDGKSIVGHGKNARGDNEAWLLVLP